MFGLSMTSRGSDGVRRHERARRGSRRVSPGVEGLEARELKTGQITFNIDTVTIDGLSSGTQATVSFDGRDWWNPFDDLYRVSLSDRATGVSIDQKAFPAGDVHLVVFNGGDGDDLFQNLTGITSIASGDAGNDTLQGGSAADSLYGGDGYDSLTGNGGNDYLRGGNQ